VDGVLLRSEAALPPSSQPLLPPGRSTASSRVTTCFRRPKDARHREHHRFPPTRELLPGVQSVAPVGSNAVRVPLNRCFHPEAALLQPYDDMPTPSERRARPQGTVASAEGRRPSVRSSAALVLAHTPSTGKQQCFHAYDDVPTPSERRATPRAPLLPPTDDVLLIIGSAALVLARTASDCGDDVIRPCGDVLPLWVMLATSRGGLPTTRRCAPSVGSSACVDPGRSASSGSSGSPDGSRAGPD
jgi:hypothetical protein